MFFLIFFACIHVKARKKELRAASKLPYNSPSTLDGFSCNKKAPNSDRSRPVIARSFNFSPLIHSSMQVKNGAKQPNKVAEAMLVRRIAVKNDAKWLPKKTPAKIMGVLFSFNNFPEGFAALYDHSIALAVSILQNAITTAGTIARCLTTRDVVLTDNKANPRIR